MPFVVVRLPCFDKQVKKALKKHKESLQYVNEVIDSLSKNKSQGDVYPGFNPISVRKMRIALPQNNIGKRSGLRLIYLSIPSKQKVLPLIIYRKTLFKTESNIRKQIQDRLKALEHELKNK